MDIVENSIDVLDYSTVPSTGNDLDRGDFGKINYILVTSN
jgi:hypothetical protein